MGKKWMTYDNRKKYLDWIEAESEVIQYEREVQQREAEKEAINSIFKKIGGSYENRPF